MADVFSKDDAKALLNRKYILFIGDSNVRSLYKDLLWLVSREGLVTACYFSRKLGNSFLDDRVLNNDGNEYSWHFSEHRSYNKDFRIDLLHMSTVKPNRIAQYVNDMKDGIVPEPDVVYFSSFCSKRNLTILEDVVNKLKNQLPKRTLFMMAKALPMVEDSFGDPLIEEIIYFKAGRIDVPDTDYCEMANRLGFMTIDPYFYTQLEIFRGFDSRRDRKGLRFLTNLILTKYAIHINRKLPGRVDNLVLRQAQLSSLACIKEYRNLERRISSGGSVPKTDPALINATQFLKMIKTKRVFLFRSDTHRKRKASSKQLDVKMRRIDKSPTELMEIEATNVGNIPHQQLNTNDCAKKGRRNKRKCGNLDIKKMSSYRGGGIKSVVFPLRTCQGPKRSDKELCETNRNETNDAKFTPPKMSYNIYGMDEMPSRLGDSSCPPQSVSRERSMFGQKDQSKTSFIGKERYETTISSDANGTQYRNQPNSFNKEVPRAQVKFSGNIKTSSLRNECSPQTTGKTTHNQNFMSWLTRNFSNDLQTENEIRSFHSNNINIDGESNRDGLHPVTSSEGDAEKKSGCNAEKDETQQVKPRSEVESPEIKPKGQARDDNSFQRYHTVNGANKPELLNMSRFLFDLREKLSVSSPQPTANMPPISLTQQSNNFKTFSFRTIPRMNQFNKTVEEKCANPFSIENVSLKSLSVQPKPAYKKWKVRKNKSPYSNWQHFPKTQSVRGDGYCMYWPPPIKTRGCSLLLHV
ncbi:uncharacterized protein LOC106668850 isoform X2 [Cimex lectularius]|uniref:Uncharacterized protein n=1 Tax=Cimex lectularius TaxID=79782 RepID=A0A8I6RXY9_CIMLE|nr:uncharacterized protein LOC106668850 isoform X2 [Cimex lectularius]